MTRQWKMRIKTLVKIAAIPLVWAFLYFYPASIVIHYPSETSLQLELPQEETVIIPYPSAVKPLQVELIQYDNSIYETTVQNESKRILLKKSNIFTWHFTENQFAELSWQVDDKYNIGSNGIIIGDTIEYLDACRVDIYIDAWGQMTDVKVTEKQLLNFCW